MFGSIGISRQVSAITQLLSVGVNRSAVQKCLLEQSSGFKAYHTELNAQHAHGATVFISGLFIHLHPRVHITRGRIVV